MRRKSKRIEILFVRVSMRAHKKIRQMLKANLRLTQTGIAKAPIFRFIKSGELDRLYEKNRHS